MAPMQLHESYAHKMSARHNYGWAFYEPPSSRLVSPGRCGYIDEQGSWNPIVDLCGDLNEFACLGLSPPSSLPDKAPSDRGIEWGPKYSDKVVGRRIDLSAGVEYVIQNIAIKGLH